MPAASTGERDEGQEGSARREYDFDEVEDIDDYDYGYIYAQARATLREDTSVQVDRPEPSDEPSNIQEDPEWRDQDL